MLGKTLKKLRNDNSLTQQKLADILGIPRGTYAHYEIGKREPDNATLLLLAKFFKVTVDYLLNNNPPETQLPKQNYEFHNDILKVLEQPEVFCDGTPLTENDKAKIKASLDIIFWDAKKKNKQEKS